MVTEERSFTPEEQTGGRLNSWNPWRRLLIDRKEIKLQGGVNILKAFFLKNNQDTHQTEARH